jgi:tetratricopeptide (TPR) repeat protein
MGTRRSTKKTLPPPIVDRRYQQALEMFERAVKALGRKDFERSRDLLDALIEDYADQQELLERARTYRAMCDRQRRPARPRTFEELLNYGVVLHNRGDFDLAVKYLRQALDIHPRNESALYCLAASQARAGDAQAAIKALKSAIHANPASRAQARRDADFEPLREAAAFQALVSPTATAP